MSSFTQKICGLLACLGLVATSASAHVGFIQTQATQDSYVRFALKIPHGCAGKSTDTVRIQLPNGIQAAKPMPKSGWALNTVRTPLTQPYSLHGKTITDDVSAIIWSQGNLPDAFYDEFVFQAKVAAQPGMLYFTVTQQCGAEQLIWDAPSHDAEHPAASLEVLPAAYTTEHRH